MLAVTLENRPDFKSNGLIGDIFLPVKDDDFAFHG
jgi:hypothetical protein